MSDTEDSSQPVTSEEVMVEEVAEDTAPPMVAPETVTIEAEPKTLPTSVGVPIERPPEEQVVAEPLVEEGVAEEVQEQAIVQIEEPESNSEPVTHSVERFSESVPESISEPVSEAALESKSEPALEIPPVPEPISSVPEVVPTTAAPEVQKGEKKAPVTEQAQAEVIKEVVKEVVKEVYLYKPTLDMMRALQKKSLISIQNRRRKKIDKIMTMFGKKEKITSSDVQKSLIVSHNTAVRYLNTLEKEGKIRQAGKKGTWVHYVKI